ncbi:MAG: alpha/beta fold hydrolase [Archangium sp.]|nr:alpha/beta fold hydrolase [Archangium sp.]
MTRALVVAVCGLVTVSCAAAERLVRPPISAPAGAEFFTAADGTRLFVSIAPADSSADPIAGRAERGAVWFVSGAEARAEPPDPTLAAALREAGFSTVVFHPRGTGFSDGLRGDADDYELFLGDHHLFLKHLLGKFERVYLLGQSAGCAFALEAAVQAPRSVSGIVLANPAWRLQTAKGMTPTFGDYLRFAWNLVFRPAALTVDMNSKPEAVEFEPDRLEGLAMQNDPLVVRYFSMRYLAAQGRVMDRIPENLAKLEVPLLLVQGAHDGLVDPKSFDELLTHSGAKDKTKLVAPEGGHGSSTVETQVDAVRAWLLAH